MAQLVVGGRRPPRLGRGAGVGLACALLALVTACGSGGEDAAVRIGWQVPWATEGQIAQSLKRTNALAVNDLEGEFIGFTYGAPLNEAALAGEVDALFTADQPAAALLARDGGWRIVARLMYNRVALYVPPESAVHDVADLDGGTVAMPFGAAAQRAALQAFEDAGLDPREDVTSVNLDILEQAEVVAAGSRESWGEFDALAGFDPTPAIFEFEGTARMIHVDTVVSLVLVSPDMAENRSEDVVDLLKAFAESYYFYASETEVADAWFLEESRLDFDPAVLEIAASVEPNVSATSPDQLSLTLSEDDLQVMQEAADFIFEADLVPRRVVMADHVDLSFLERALDELADEPDAFTRITATEEG